MLVKVKVSKQFCINHFRDHRTPQLLHVTQLEKIRMYSFLNSIKHESLFLKQEMKLKPIHKLAEELEY